MIRQAVPKTTLVRYGRIPEVARFDFPDEDAIERGDAVVVQTHRGLMLGEFLEEVPTGNEEVERSKILRKATDQDLSNYRRNSEQCASSFDDWCARIVDWKVDLQLVDLETTLDGEKLILYVLNERGPDCTKLALHAAAAGLGIIEVQPIDANGLVDLPNSGGGG